MCSNCSRYMRYFGYNCDALPLLIDEAVEELTKTIETNNVHIYLHIHKHTHKNIREFIDSYDHRP